MTKTEARRLTRRARQYGYFKHPATPDYPGGRLEVTCPVCGEQVPSSRNYREFPAPKGKPANVRADGSRYVFRQETDIEAIDRAMMAHLHGDDKVVQGMTNTDDPRVRVVNHGAGNWRTEVWDGEEWSITGPPHVSKTTALISVPEVVAYHYGTAAELAARRTGNRLYIWQDVLCDYTCGMIAVLAPDLDAALAIARAHPDFSEWMTGDMAATEPVVIDAPATAEPALWYAKGGG